MGSGDRRRTQERTKPPQTQGPTWIRLWCVAVWGLLCVEFIWGGFPDRPEGVTWLEARGPLIPVGAALLALLVVAAVQAKWSKRRAWESAGVGRLGLGRCPAWFEYAVLGLLTVGSVLYAYAGFRSLGGDASLFALQRRAAILLLLGAYLFVELISWLSDRGRREEACKDDEALESPSDLEPFRRALAVAFMVLPLGAFIALALAGGRASALAVALAAVAGLFAVAHLLAWWNRGAGRAPSGAVLPSLQSCPALFGYLVLGLTMVLIIYFLYVAFWTPNEHVGDAPHVVVRLAPLAVFLIGSVCLLLLPIRRPFAKAKRRASLEP